MFNVGSSEILQIVEAVAREKGLPKEPLITALEQAIAIAGRGKYGHEHDIRAEINRKNGEVKLFRVLKVVDAASNSFTEIDLSEAMEQNPNVKLGDEVHEILPPIDLGRVAAQSAKQVIIQAVTQAEREKQYHDFKNRKGEILSGIIKRIEFGNVIVDLGRTEAIIRKDQLIKGEQLKINDRIKAYVQDVKLESKGPLISLSRTDDRMLAKLFELEVPEIYENVIEIKGIARDPGSKAKIAVYAADSGVDPIGSCVGLKGSRVRAVTNELNGEKIDVILWTNNVAQFVINSMAPAEIAKIVIDEDKHRVEIVVPTDQLSIAIGRRGQNVRLASRLTGWSIDVMTEEQESKRRSDEFNKVTSLFMEALDVEEVIAQLLSVEGFSTVEQLAAADINNLVSIEGFDEALAAEISARANNYVNSKNEEIVLKLEELGVEQELIDILEEVQPEYILKLAEYGIKTIEDLGELNLSEFKSLVPHSNFSDDDIELLIKTAREHGKEQN